MYEPPSDDRPFNPKFHEFFRGGYRGPYPQSNDPRPPGGWAAKEGFDAPIGSRVRLRFAADPRGNDLLRVNRAGGVEGPPWDIMGKVRTLVVRHDTDASKDIRVAVTPRLDGYRVRFDPEDKKWEDFRKVDNMEGFSGPYAVVQDFEFDAEVHSDQRLDEELAGRRSLVPLHEQSEPIGPFGTLPYPPHPAELAQTGMAGPFLVTGGGELVVTRFSERFGENGGWLLGLTALVFGLSTIAVYSGYAGRCAAHLAGSWATQPARLLVVASAAAGGLLAFEPLMGWVMTSMAVVMTVNLLAIALVRSSRGDEPGAEK
jgi:hypothetical protein